MAPAYEQAAAELEPQVRVAKLDTEQAQSLGTRYNIRSIPTLVLFAGGQEIARRAGALGANDIVYWARSNLPRQNRDLYDSIVNADVPGREGDSIATRPASTK